MSSHSAHVQIFLHINHGPTYRIGKYGYDELHLHPAESDATFKEGQSKLAILEIIIDGESTRKAVLISRYSKMKIHLKQQ